MRAEVSPLVCVCQHVRECDILVAVRSGCRDVATVQEATGAGTGCRDCVPDIEELLEDEAVGVP